MLSRPDIQFNFPAGAAWRGAGSGGGAVVPPSSLLTVTRASTAMVDDLKGQWRTFPAATGARSDKGMTSWTARTNLALWCRDLTNAAWAKVTMTTALTATGIDGTANAATTCTAAGASSTILQTVTQVSTADTVSFFVRRRTGTGTIEVTPDGIAFTDITAALATAATATPGGWYRATVSATLVNPVFGLRITTSTDAVDVDFAQLEAGTFASSPIATTTVSVARAADVAVVTTPPTFPTNEAVLIAEAVPQAVDAFATNQAPADVSDTTIQNRITMFRAATTPTYNGIIVASNSTLLNSGGGGGTAWSQFLKARAGAEYQVGGQRVATTLSTSVGSASSATALAAALTKMSIGARFDGTQQFQGYVTLVASYSRFLAQENLRDLVTKP